MSRSERVEGSVALVTGGGSGIRSARRRYLAEEGAKITVIDIDRTAGEVVAGALPGCAEAMFLCCDVTVPDAIADVV
jgi:NAD(P)-dependent dehydrogenase (short-subunit alcohol dehydrogenase family)